MLGPVRLDDSHPARLFLRTLPEPHPAPPIVTCARHSTWDRYLVHIPQTDTRADRQAGTPSISSSSSYSSSSGLNRLSTRPTTTRMMPSSPDTIGTITLSALILVVPLLSVLTLEATLAGVVLKSACRSTSRVVPVLSCSVSDTF